MNGPMWAYIMRTYGDKDPGEFLSRAYGGERELEEPGRPAGPADQIRWGLDCIRRTYGGHR